MDTKGSINGQHKHRPPSHRITTKWPLHDGGANREADREALTYTEESHFNTWSTFWAVVAARSYPTMWAEPEGEFERVDQGREIWRCVSIPYFFLSYLTLYNHAPKGILILCEGGELLIFTANIAYIEDLQLP